MDGSVVDSVNVHLQVYARKLLSEPLFIVIVIAACMLFRLVLLFILRILLTLSCPPVARTDWPCSHHSRIIARINTVHLH